LFQTLQCSKNARRAKANNMAGFSTIRLGIMNCFIFNNYLFSVFEIPLLSAKKLWDVFLHPAIYGGFQYVELNRMLYPIVRYTALRISSMESTVSGAMRSSSSTGMMLGFYPKNVPKVREFR
jgi:hypothetical protein